jgi:hypothetical protein
MNLLYNSETVMKNDVENNFCDLNDLCKNINIIKNISIFNYIDKIHQNKKEFEKIEGMKKNELIKNSEICKGEYEKCLFEIKKYSDIINLEKLRKSYKNINNLTDEELNNVFKDIVMKIKHKLPKNKSEKIAEDLYNLIYYENKINLIKKTINKQKI